MEKKKMVRCVLIASLVMAVPVLASANGGQQAGSSGGGGSSGSAPKKTVLTLLWVSNNVIDGHELIFAEFEKRTGIKIEVETRVGGAEGENIMKTRLSSGDMTDIFGWNTGSKVNDINPAKNCVDLTSDFASKLEKGFVVGATATDGKLYSVPMDYGAQAGAVLYNKKIYAQLGLQVPKTWADFLANCKKIQDAGITPILGTYKTTWTSQMIFLSDEYNIKAAMPDWPAQYTAHKATWESNPVAGKSFQKLADVAPFLNKDYLATTLEQGYEKLANGEVVHFPMQSHRLTMVAANYPDKVEDIGLFALPGDDPNNVGLTVWEPSGFYINKASKNIDAAKQFLTFLLSQDAYNLYTSKMRVGGPPVVLGLKLPANALGAVKDAQKYFDSGKVAPALEFESPIKGPSLEQLCIEVTTGRMTPADAAKNYDEDVKKQAVLLNLPGWN